MAELLAVTLPDGSLELIARGRRNAGDLETPEYAVNARLIDTSELPESREHREAWIDDGARIRVDPERIRPHQTQSVAVASAPTPVVLHKTIESQFDDRPLHMRIDELQSRLDELAQQPEPEPVDHPDYVTETAVQPPPTPPAAPVMDDDDPNDLPAFLRTMEVPPEPVMAEPTPAVLEPDVWDEPEQPAVEIEHKRRAGLISFRNALQEAQGRLAHGQLRYEQAMRAHNGDPAAMRNLSVLVEATGEAPQDLIRRILSERQHQEAEAIRLEALEINYERRFAMAGADEIEALTAAALNEIGGT